MALELLNNFAIYRALLHFVKNICQQVSIDMLCLFTMIEGSKRK